MTPSQKKEFDRVVADEARFSGQTIQAVLENTYAEGRALAARRDAERIAKNTAEYDARCAKRVARAAAGA